MAAGVWLAQPAPVFAQAAPPPENPPAESPPPDARLNPGEPGAELPPGASRWFPATRLFRAPIVDPGEPGVRGSALHTDLLSGEYPNGERPPPDVPGLRRDGRDFHGVVSLGDTYAIRRFGQGRTGVQVGLQVGVTARFRLASAANEYVASDWLVGLPVEFARGPVSGRATLFHRSAHLGDEIIERAGARRVGFGHEGITVLVGNPPGDGPIRFYGGGTRILRSEVSSTLTELGRAWRDRWEVQAGIEFERGLPGPGSRLAGFSALGVRSAERTNWRPQWTALAGAAFRVGGRSGRAALRWLHGPSMHGEFFLTPESAWGVELRLTR
jgi:hypothetical protein